MSMPTGRSDAHRDGVVGRAAAPRGDASDTRTGPDLPGRSSPTLAKNEYVVSYCHRCEHLGHFSAALPCPRCHFNPWASGLPPHDTVVAEWVPSHTLWKPWTWGEGHFAVRQSDPMTELRNRVNWSHARVLAARRELAAALAEQERADQEFQRALTEPPHIRRRSP